MEAAKPGEVRLREVICDIEDDGNGGWRRVVPGWYVEEYREGWQRVAGPYMPSLYGVPRAARDEAARRGAG